MPRHFTDPYLDPRTGILKNLIGAKTANELRKAEGDIVALSEISLTEISHSVDLLELQKIHRSLFGRIYSWAGELRTVDIRKGSKEYFLQYQYLKNGTSYVFSELKAKNYLQCLEPADFIQELAYFYEQPNFIHPFREGNGRTQRIFWQRVANEAGYSIDWSKVVGDELDNASLRGRVDHDLQPLEDMFAQIVTRLP